MVHWKSQQLSVLADLDVYMECQDIESYCRFGKADRQKF